VMWKATIHGAATADGLFSAAGAKTGYIRTRIYAISMKMAKPANLSCCLNKRQIIMTIRFFRSIFLNL